MANASGAASCLQITGFNSHGIENKGCLEPGQEVPRRVFAARHGTACLDADGEGSDESDEERCVGHKVDNLVILNHRHDCSSSADGPEEHIEVMLSRPLPLFVEVISSQRQARQPLRL